MFYIHIYWPYMMLTLFMILIKTLEYLKTLITFTLYFKRVQRNRLQKHNYKSFNEGNVILTPIDIYHKKKKYKILIKSNKLSHIYFLIKTLLLKTCLVFKWVALYNSVQCLCCKKFWLAVYKNQAKNQPCFWIILIS